MSVRTISVIGTTGSVGTQAIDVVTANPDRFAVSALAAGSNRVLLVEQAVRLGARRIGLADPGDAGEATIRDMLAREAARQGLPDRVEAIELGPEASERIAAADADVVLNAVTGAVGLRSTLAALEAGTDVALANKESLIVGGPVVLDAAARSGARLIPVDSEHSAIAQALRAGRTGEVERLVITASGGPFRGMSPTELESVTPAQALVHPTWNMGTVITTNSATLVNKGLEVIEAHLLFGIDYDRIDVVVHPQSQIHSMVEYIDGSTLAQVSPPDMRLPIAYALGTGTDGTTRRVPGAAAPNDWTTPTSWTFEPVDSAAFPALDLAYRAGRLGHTAPAVYNAANEVLVEAFHAGRVTFPQISAGIAAALDALSGDAPAAADVLTVDSVLAADSRARDHARDWIAQAGAEQMRTVR
ncbi:1-deoxy-D-xylulose-5-phosphate reductoisomerase [uncultured Brevibacterium sp.]|uniref:1-deoxy-D-xylulose-5-phosphate reductoisomerase n=1 Tax=uncultured Brevibacterium sp. TaxID=189678 RepID=UPI0025CD5D31|nr:1-deoxy-D-xylulose-5-phosphate reductoisomerase [uncultured Brevibacterium sp.]